VTAQPDISLEAMGVSSEIDQMTASPVNPVAIGDAPLRRRVVVGGQVTQAGAADLGGGPAYSCTLDDGTGSLSLIFFGRTQHPEIQVGAPIVVEGTIGSRAGGSAILNPLIRRP
jgi:DNA/RNA endonuclease YhcR with UshA esterase domain